MLNMCLDLEIKVRIFLVSGLSTFGYRVFLQALAFHKPNIALAKIPQVRNLPYCVNNIKIFQINHNSN